MSTTQLFVEHLIAGALTLFGIVIIILAIGGVDFSIIENIFSRRIISQIICKTKNGKNLEKIWNSLFNYFYLFSFLFTETIIL